MADEPINELIPIPDGGDAEAKPLRQNFTYLDNQIKSLKSNLDNKVTTSSIDGANGICPLNSNRKIPDGNIDYTNIDKKITTLGNTCVKTSGNQTVAGNKTFSGKSTFSGTVLVPNSSGTKTACSTVGISTSAKGYMRLGNGFIIQWGKGTLAKNAWKITDKFALTFPHSCRSIIAMHNSSQANNAAICATHVNSASEFTITVNGTWDGGTMSYFWIAVGY